MAARTSVSHKPKNPPFCAWLRDAGHRATTVRSYDYRAASFIEWSSGRLPENALLRAYADYLRLDRQLRPRTLQTHYAAVSQYCAYLKSQGLLHHLPDCGPLRGGRLDRPDRPVATDADLTLLWATARALPEHTLRERYLKWRALLCLGVCCYVGARRSEVLHLELSDIQRGEPWQVRIVDGKGGETRWLPVHPDLRAILEVWLPLRDEWAKTYGHTSEALVPVDRVRRLGEAGLADLFHNLAKRAGVKRRLTPHAFRHWAISTTCEQSGLKAAQVVAGHQSPRTTELYLHASPEQVEAAINSLPSFTRHTPQESSDLYRQIL